MSYSIFNIHKLFTASTGITTDSRNIPQGSMFVALRGQNFDGNDFALQALAQGAAYAIIDKDLQSADRRLIRVPDCMNVLQRLANLHRRRMKAKVIAITGTNGKTTTKELIAAVLGCKYNVLATEGNYNNALGVPLTLLRLRVEHEIAIIEMGASHPGDIRQLVEIAEPDAGLITNVGKAHLEGFGTFENIVKTKAELYDYLMKNHCPIFINRDNPILCTALGDYATTYSYPDDLTLLDGGDTIAYHWMRGDVKTQIVGRYNFENIRAAIAVGKYFMVPEQSAHKAIAAYEPRNHRSQLIRSERGNTIIADTYNANPTSMTAAILNYDSMKTDGLKMLILGDMRELGRESQTEHRVILERLKNANLHRIILVGTEFAYAFNEIGNLRPGLFEVYKSRQALEQELVNHPIQNALILVKGSHGIGLEQILPLL